MKKAKEGVLRRELVIRSCLQIAVFFFSLCSVRRENVREKPQRLFPFLLTLPPHTFGCLSLCSVPIQAFNVLILK